MNVYWKVYIFCFFAVDHFKWACGEANSFHVVSKLISARKSCMHNDYNTINKKLDYSLSRCNF